MAQSAVTISIIAVLAAFGSAATLVELKLSATDLKDQDICCVPGVYPPDTYVIVYYAADSVGSLKEVGRTSVIDNDNNPVWPNIFTFNVTNHQPNARVRFDLWDEDVVDSDDYIGFVELRLYDLINAFGHVLSRPIELATQGQLTITGRINGSSVRASDDLMFSNAPGPILTPVHPRRKVMQPNILED